MDEPKVFDIAKPKPASGTRPVIASIPAPDPMVKVAARQVEAPDSAAESIKVNVVPAASQPAATAAPVQESPAEPAPADPKVEPEITSIPVSQAPEPAPAAEPILQQTEAPGTVSPALPGVTGSSFDNIPKFGELQPKVDAHPLFSGKKDHRVKVRRLPRLAMPLTTLLVLLIVGYLAVDAGAIRGYAHLPYHFFKQKPVAEAPAITTPTAQAAASTTGQQNSANSTNSTSTTDSIYAGWKAYTLKYEKLSFKYPSGWTVKDTSANNSDAVALNGPNNFVVNISTGGLGHPSTDTKQPVIGAKTVTFLGKTGFFDFVSTGNDNLIEQANLSSSSSNAFATFASKASGQNSSAGGNFVITAAYTGTPAPKGLNLAAATADQNYLDAQNVITSMAY